jgi:hypothetical protein
MAAHFRMGMFWDRNLGYSQTIPCRMVEYDNRCHPARYYIPFDELVAATYIADTSFHSSKYSCSISY